VSHKTPVPQLRATIDLLVAEVKKPMEGSEHIISCLIELMFLHTIRSYVREDCKMCSEIGPSWLRAVTDKKLRRVLIAIHRDPLRSCTVTSLAAIARMSRTAFALHFRATMGYSPLHYVTRWRLHLAARKLNDKQTSISEAAVVSGYTSEAAFARAFKRTFGVTPGEWRKTANV
jgi:AraC-like DNA-binding protein